MITSPTFTLVGEFNSGRLPLYHFDVYRLDDTAATTFAEVGYEEYFYGAGVTIVEWADLIGWLLPEYAIWISLSHTEEPNVRLVEKTSNKTKGDGSCVPPMFAGHRNRSLIFEAKKCLGNWISLLKNTTSLRQRLPILRS
jgi:hypothetical protein